MRRQNKFYLQRKKRQNKKIVGTSIKPRLSVFRSNKHIYAQIIDDVKGITLNASNTLQIKNKIQKTSNCAAAFEVGKTIALKILKQNIKTIVFDSEKISYQGRVENLINGARNIGLVF